MMKRVVCMFLFLMPGLLSQGQEVESVEDFIISVTSNYKNPIANYPLRQDIFLPSSEEWKQIEKNNDRPTNAVVTGSFVFMDSDSELNRDRFLTASGDLMFTNRMYQGLSKTSSYAYHQRRHKLLMEKNVNIGKFLWYNEQFKKLKN